MIKDGQTDVGEEEAWKVFAAQGAENRIFIGENTRNMMCVIIDFTAKRKTTATTAVNGRNTTGENEMRLLLECQSVMKALELATVAHRGQVDKAGCEYINHPITVAEMLNTEEEQTAALLHDVVEDTDITIDKLRECGFSERVVVAVDCLTHRSGESRKDYLRRISENPLAVRVKLADLEHNSDLIRLANPTEKDMARTAKYKREMEWLRAECAIE